jgi:hypothetical protein
MSREKTSLHICCTFFTITVNTTLDNQQSNNSRQHWHHGTCNQRRQPRGHINSNSKEESVPFGP